MSWTAGELGDFLTLKRGHDLPNGSRQPGEVPVVSSSGFTGWHSEAKAEPPGVVTGRYGTIGEVFYVAEPYWPLNTALYVIDFKGNDPKFISYFLRHHLKNYQSNKAAVPGVDRKVLHKLAARCPDSQVQQGIVQVLSAYDDLIGNNRRRIALLEEAARQLYKEWFVRFRFPGHEHVKIIDGVPAGWERLPLGGLLTLQRGFDLPTSDRNEGSVPVYGSTGIVGYHDTAKVEAPMLITGRSGSLGQVCLVSVPCWPLNTALWVREFKRASPWFSYFLLVDMGLEKFNGGASVPTLDRKVAHAAPVMLPTGSLMEQFDETARQGFELIDTLDRQNSELARARDLLLPKLMSGAIAV